MKRKRLMGNLCCCGISAGCFSYFSEGLWFLRDLNGNALNKSLNEQYQCLRVYPTFLERRTD